MKKISKTELLTPQEHIMLGSTPPVDPKNDEEWYIPTGVLMRRLSIKMAMEGRKELGHLESGIMAGLIGLKNERISLGLQDLDPKTGKTLNDPEILGVWDDKNKVVREVKDRDLTRELFDKLLNGGIDLRLRPNAVEGKEGRVNLSENPPGFRS